MDPRYNRATSPPRRFGHSARASTGGLDLHHPPNYESYYQDPRSSRDGLYNPRLSDERMMAPRVAPRPRDTLPLRVRNPDDYYVPPRRLQPLEPITSSRRPLTVVPGSPGRSRPAVSSAIDVRPRGGDESLYVVPPSSSRHHHYRNFSAGSSDMDRYLTVNRSDRDRPERGVYRGPTQQQVYQNAPMIRPRQDKDDRDYGYEYTNWQEQDSQRETEPRPRRRGSDTGARERPHSIVGIEDYLQQKPRDSRESGPPPSTRGFSKIDRNGSVRHQYRYPRDSDAPSRDSSLTRGGGRDSSDSLARRRSTRAPVSVHQDFHDGYSSNVEDRPHDRHRHSSRRAESIDRTADGGLGIRYPDERPRKHDAARSESHDRHQHRSHRHGHRREESEDRHRGYESSRRPDRGEESDRERERERKHRDRGEESDREREKRHRDRDRNRDRDRDDYRKEKTGDSKLGEGVAIGAAGAAAAGAIAEGARRRHERDSPEVESDSRRKSRRHELSRESAVVNSETSKSSDSNSEAERKDRRRRRRHEREAKERAEERQARGDEYVAPKDGGRERSGTIEKGGEYPVPVSVPEGEEPRRRRRRRHHKRSEERDSYSDDSSDEKNPAPREHRPSQVRVVSPGNDLESKPKGILRQPTEKFPEDPAPIREGVAPLKEAGKKGIPPNARWTKIDRRLVNPEALEQGNERFEERLEFVIVLRVLTKEEIEQYAQRTAEIRGISPK